ncbi:MAG: hypothetical protein ACFFCS_12150 [Candidatus Hodarchaeota archaeon]
MCRAAVIPVAGPDRLYPLLFPASITSGVRGVLFGERTPALGDSRLTWLQGGSS